MLGFACLTAQQTCRELVAADALDRVPLAEHTAWFVGKSLPGPIALGVAENIAGLSRAVQIEKDQGLRINRTKGTRDLRSHGRIRMNLR
jgi:hypothetical protein